MKSVICVCRISLLLCFSCFNQSNESAEVGIFMFFGFASESLASYLFPILFVFSFSSRALFVLEYYVRNVSFRYSVFGSMRSTFI